jgi:hypothetical protein
MDSRSQEDGERRWGRVPTVATVRREPTRAALPWVAVLARLSEAVATGALAEPREPAAARSLNHQSSTLG